MKRFGWFALGAGLTWLLLHFTHAAHERGGGIDRRELVARHDRQAILQDFAISTFLIPIERGALVAWVRPHSLVDLMGLHAGDVVGLNAVTRDGELLLVDRKGKIVMLRLSVPE